MGFFNKTKSALLLLVTSLVAVLIFFSFSFSSSFSSFSSFSSSSSSSSSFYVLNYYLLKYKFQLEEVGDVVPARPKKMPRLVTAEDVN